MCERSWRPNITEYFHPNLWPSALCLSRSPWLLNRSPGVESARRWLSLLHLVYLPSKLSRLNSTRLSTGSSNSTVLLLFNSSAYITFKLPRGDMDTSPHLRNFFRYLATGYVSLRYLWNGLCDRHRAEINCHPFQRSLSSGASVYESIMGFFYLVPFHQPIPPTRFPLITAIRVCHFLPVHHLEWHF